MNYKWLMCMVVQNDEIQDRLIFQCFILKSVDFCSLKKDGKIIMSERQTKMSLLGRSDT